MHKKLALAVLVILLTVSTMSWIYTPATFATPTTDTYVSDTTDLWWSGATSGNIDPDGYIVPPDGTWQSAVLCWVHPNWNTMLYPDSLKTKLFEHPSANWIWKSYQVTYEESITGDIIFFKEKIDIPPSALSITADLFIITADNAYYFYVNKPSWSGTPDGIDGFASGYDPTNFYYEETDGKLRPLDKAIPSDVTYWSSIEVWTISDLFHTGENWLQIVAINEHSPPSGATNNPAGLIYKLVISYETPIEVNIDIKPGSDPNSICLNDQGVLPVAILGSTDFDVTSIDPETIMIGGAKLAERGSIKKPKLAYSFEDVNDDGYTDLIAFFDVQALVTADPPILTLDTTELTLDAYLYDGSPIMGTDSVRVVPP